MPTDTSNSMIQLRAASGEINLYESQPSTSSRIKFNKEYINGLCEGYILKIDELIEKVNLSENLDKKTKDKICALMISLVLDNSDIIELKKISKLKDVSSVIPNMTEIQYINDIPFDLDIVENVFKYIVKTLKGSNTIEGSQFGGVYFDNSKDFYDVFSVDVIIGEYTPREVLQDIEIFNKKNKLIRQRLFDLASKGKKVNKLDEIKIRRTYKFDPASQSFQKRPKAISKKVYELLAEKIATAYDSLYSTIK